MFPKIYLDLDGVLADFDAAKPILPEFATDEDMWKEIDKDPHWYLKLNLMPEARKLYNYCDMWWDVQILTAIPKKAVKEYAASDKRKWTKKHFGGLINVNVCYREEKQKWAGPNQILIDDSGSNIGQWVSKGGIGILHHDVEETLDVLRELRKAGLYDKSLSDRY